MVETSSPADDTQLGLIGSHSMNAANCALANGLVSAAYIQQGQQALTARCNLVKSLLSQRKLPADGWDDATIEMLLQVSATDGSIVPAFHVF